MKSPLRILHLEDDPNDAALVRAALEADGIACATTVVHERAAFVSALERGRVDLVLSDHTLPAFDGPSATTTVRARWPDLPVILVSGTLGEELAIEALKNGATDYVLKRQLARLAPAVRRAMEEVDARVERRRLDAQFIEAQKMEVLGRLAGGVAHDFNNILAVISGYSDLLSARLESDSPLRAYTEEIKLASSRGAALTGQLLVFSRKQKVQLLSMDLSKAVRGMETMLRRLIDENIAFVVDTEVPVWKILADAGYVGQVLMNLVVNGRDAMPNGGQLTVSTRNVTRDGDYVCTHRGATAGDFVVLRVHDTGEGMSEQVKARLFEPFFTTKEAGKGTGLGLATCRTIVQHAGGYITVDSDVGSGTTMEVHFPRCKEHVADVTPPVQAGAPASGTETVMVVEDEPSVRHLTCTILESLGYRVLRAHNGQEGLRVARELGGEALQLVITDLVMPVMGGKAMAAKLRAVNPELRILFTSGYADEDSIGLSVSDLESAFLQKPYTTTDLAHRVREILDRPRARCRA